MSRPSTFQTHSCSSRVVPGRTACRRFYPGIDPCLYRADGAIGRASAGSMFRVTRVEGLSFHHNTHPPNKENSGTADNHAGLERKEFTADFYTYPCCSEENGAENPGKYKEENTSNSGVQGKSIPHQ
jgi:hypothetical protein